MNGNITHKVRLDKSITVSIDIPEEMDALEFSSIVEKARKLLRLSEVEIEKISEGPIEEAERKLAKPKKYSRDNEDVVHTIKMGLQHGTKIVDIAKSMGRSKQNIYSLIHKHGLRLN